MSSGSGEGAGTAGLSLGSAVGVGFGLEEDLEMVVELLPADCAGGALVQQAARDNRHQDQAKH
jgi:hypothetical protein